MIDRRTTVAAALLALAAGWAAERAEAASLDKGLIRGSDQVLQAIVEEIGSGCTVGVLPFQVQKGGRQAGFDSAPLATSLPGRIENALIVAQEGKSRAPIVVIRDAVTTANKAKVGPWMTKQASFAKLFATDYTPAWGNGTKKPDAFLTGKVRSNPAGKFTTQVDVHLVVAKKDAKSTIGTWSGSKLDLGKPVATLTVETDRALLRDLGYAYALPRSMVRKRSAEQLDEDARQQVQKEEQGQKQAPTQQTQHTPTEFAGFRIEVKYDGVAQAIQARQGSSQSQQPAYRLSPATPGQAVMIYLTRVSADEGKLGAVLKVNGKSTWEEQDADSIGCKKWIFGPEAAGKPWDFAGFYSKDSGGKEQVKKFRVLTPQESETRVSELGSRAGWIDVDVFAAGGEAGGGGSQEQELMVTTRGAPKARGKTLQDVQAKVSKANNLKLVRSKSPIKPRNIILMDAEPASADPIGSDQLPNPKRVGGISIQYYENAGGGKVTD